MPDEDNNFGGSLGLDKKKKWRHVQPKNRGINSFKVIVGATTNAVITYVSKLYPGSISDKAIVPQ